ncbi:lipopolysaccharide biosynthesis protein [Yeosuana marina]|uniref:lipopolysaccharide biosynthesis protein n=1 Tax=Yeosuana marina TaxID=1565536 RepID=UPI00141E94D6|nr:sugar transporter [Yeosuana marina]
MSRTKKTIKNARISLIFYILFTLVAFFSRKIFLDYLGPEFLGLTATVSNILGFLNLAELGVGTTIGVFLYKPLYDENHDEINKIISVLGYIYKKIGIIVLIIAIVVSCFFPLIFSKVTISLPIIYLCFYVFLTNSLLGYFVNYHQTLLYTDQKGYIIAIYYQSANLLRIILQSLIAYYYQSFLLWIILEFIFSIIYAVIIRWKVRQEYLWLKFNLIASKEDLVNYKDIFKKIKQVFFHKFSHVIFTSTDQLMIYIYVSLESVAYYNNYLLVFGKATSLLNNFFEGTKAAIGNLVAENDSKKIKKVFWEMMALRFFIGGFLFITLLYLTEPFITLWLGEKYIMDPTILLLLLISLFLGQIIIPIENFLNAYGLFQDIWAPTTQAVLNIIISIILGKLMGISGIILGSILSTLLIIVPWKPYFLYSKGFEKSVSEYWIGFFKLAMPFIGTLIIIKYILFNVVLSDKITTVIDWIYLAIKTSIIAVLVYGSLLFIINQGFRDLFKRFYMMSNNLINKILK